MCAIDVQMRILPADIGLGHMSLPLITTVLVMTLGILSEAKL